MYRILHSDIDIHEQVLELEQEGKEQGDWGFKALKQMIKISFRLVSVLLELYYAYDCNVLNLCDNQYKYIEYITVYICKCFTSVL